jgi:O-antigen/teichoic acid export membrane protein
MILVIGGIFSPLVPAVSSLQTQQSRYQTGRLMIEATRYCTLLLCLFGLPLAFGAYPVMKLWIGRSYAVQSIYFLQILILGNVIRQLAYPYSLAVIATGKQHLATIAAVAEALVNVCVSLYLVQKIGAAGVAFGTVIGAFVSVGLHLTVSMKYTQSAIGISRRNFVLQGILRPLLCTVPSVLLIPVWNRFAMLPWNMPWLVAWATATLLITWQVALTAADRRRVSMALSKLTRFHYAT